MCAADLAIAAADTRFTLAYANIGASPDGGSTHFLPRLVGYKKAMELIMLPDQPVALRLTPRPLAIAQPQPPVV